MGKASDKAAKKGQNMPTSHKSPTHPQTPDVKMTIEEEADNDDDYITEEEFVRDYHHFNISRGHLLNMTY